MSLGDGVKWGGIMEEYYIFSLLFDILLTVLCYGITWARWDDAIGMEIVGLIAMAIAGTLMVVITICGMIRYIKGKNNVASVLTMKLTLLFLSVGVMFYTKDKLVNADASKFYFSLGVACLFICLTINIIQLMIKKDAAPVRWCRNRKKEGKPAAGTAEVPKPGIMERYKVEWLWDAASEVYCRNNNKTAEELSDEDESKIYDLAANDAALLVTWVIMHDFFVADDDDMDKWFKEVKDREQTGLSFLAGACDYKLSRSDFSEEIIGFIDDYFEYDGAHKSGDFSKDYETYVTSVLKQELYTVDFSWDEYDAFKEYIDSAYQKYVMSLGDGVSGP